MNLTSAEVEYGLKEFIQGVILGVIFGLLLATYLI